MADYAVYLHPVMVIKVKVNAIDKIDAISQAENNLYWDQMARYMAKGDSCIEFCEWSGETPYSMVATLGPGDEDWEDDTYFTGDSHPRVLDPYEEQVWVKREPKEA